MLFDMVARFTDIGAATYQSNLKAIKKQQGAVVESANMMRTTYLYLAFGLLAAGAMMSRVGKVINKVTETNISTFKDLQYQAIVTGNMMGRFGEDADYLMQSFLKLGRVTEWTATEAAEVGRVYALAGKRFEDTQEGMAEATKTFGAVLNLATIGEIDHIAAARTAIDIT
ncbi:MAG: hypothetical protein DRN17_07140, partial [Thermoplasmata archaeon]